jgi:DNA-binding NarL/FixJ family response regulator
MSGCNIVGARKDRKPYARVLHCKRAECHICEVMRRFGVTRAEIHIISLICIGLSNKRICEVRGISEETVKRELSDVCDKTGADDRLNLALWAIHHGLDWRKIA